MTRSRADFRFFSQLRVRWVEVDMQKIVFNGHYLMYLDTAVADYWRALALPYERSMHELQGDLFVVKSSLEYHASAQYDDVLDIGLKCSKLGNSSMEISGGIFLGQKKLVSAQLIYVFADALTKRAKTLADPLRKVLEDFESHRPVTQMAMGNWAELKSDALPLRLEVFVKEQGVPLELEQDEDDDKSQHIVLKNALGVVVATARLLPPVQGESRLGRMAVERQLRGHDLGSGMLNALIKVAQNRGDQRIRIHAQESAQAFYAKHGFKPVGERFLEAGMAHIEMCLDLGSMRTQKV
jgi:YbgC/YbaW family acyl-CoA thioester hydrolase